MSGPGTLVCDPCPGRGPFKVVYVIHLHSSVLQQLAAVTTQFESNEALFEMLKKQQKQ